MDEEKEMARAIKLSLLLVDPTDTKGEPLNRDDVLRIFDRTDYLVYTDNVHSYSFPWNEELEMNTVGCTYTEALAECVMLNEEGEENDD